MKISAVVVNYNSSGYLEKCVGSLLEHLDVSAGKDEIIVVDNCSTDGSLDAVEGLKTVKAVRSRTNLGYGGGCNAGFEQSAGDVLMFMNPDADLVTSVDSVRAIFQSDPLCAVVAPVMIEDGVPCDSLKPFPTVLSDALGEIGLEWRSASRHPVITGRGRAGDYFNGFSTGAAIFVRRDAFVKVGRFDGSFFLYYEETDLFKRLADAGYRFVYAPGCAVEHASGGCSRRLDWRKTAIRYNSKLRYFSKHFSGKRLVAHKALTIAELMLKSAANLTGISRRSAGNGKLGGYLYAMRIYAERYVPWQP